MSNRPMVAMTTRIDIGVCTFRRPELEETLRSLAMIGVPDGASVRIIVADNDTVPSARERVEALRPIVPFGIVYVHCPASNISIARNACLDHADGDFLAFVDDDETVTEFWLVRLLETARETGAEVVLGPVTADYAETAPGWMRTGDFHSTLPVWIGDEIRTGYTCNTLLRLASPALEGRRFNLALGKTGGEDTEFFTHLHQAGGRIVFSADALVHEPVPQKRASLSWLAKRRYRMGQTHGRLVGETRGAIARFAQIALAAAKAGFCALAGAVFLFSPVRRYRYWLRGALHAGAIGGLLGLREIRQYGTLEATSP
ncbi:MAG: glycosyltransferase family 2 protein [Shinella sp.]|nr:glycosyltransferase family 2 protein [Shinella sp.]